MRPLRLTTRMLPAGTLYLALLITGMAALAVPLSRPANAAESTFCVRCVEPDQTYRCKVSYPDNVQPGQSLQLYCIINLARRANHASCAARQTAAEPCNGTETTLAYSGPELPIDSGVAAADQAIEPKDPDATSQPGEQVGTVAGGQASPTEPPRTLVEATDRVYESSKQQIQNAGEAVGNATTTVGKATKTIGKTVKNSASSAGRTVTKGASKAGQAITNAVKSTYDCLTSLFSDCN